MPQLSSTCALPCLLRQWLGLTVYAKKKKRKTTQAVETTPHIDQGKESHFGTEYWSDSLCHSYQALVPCTTTTGFKIYWATVITASDPCHRFYTK
jgi:hypothetical protein